MEDVKQAVRIVSKEGGVGQATPQPVVVFCIPGNNFSGLFFRNWNEFIIQCIMNGIQPILSNGEDAVVYYARNKCLGGSVLRGIYQKPFDGKVKYTHMMWIDSDIIFSFNHFSQLLNRNLPIVAGMYLTADGFTYPVVTEWNKEYFKKNGSFKFLTEPEAAKLKDPFEVVYTGFGFFLAKYGVFESLEYPWFRPLDQEISETIKDFSSEDVSVCQLIREKGHKIFVDPTVVVGHEKKKVILPERLYNR